MAIRVICACGVQLKTKDESVGKRLRCPVCQATIAVPSKSGFPAAPKSAEMVIENPVTPISSPSAKKNSSIWLPILGIGVVVLAVVAFVVANRGETHKVAAIKPDKVDVPAKPAEEGTKKPSEAPQASVKDDRVRSLLTKADLAYGDDEAEIVWLVKRMIDKVQESGQTLTPEEALEGSLRWAMPGYFSREKQAKFSEYFAFYLTARVAQKLNHRQSIRSLHYVASALDLKSKESVGPEFDAAFEAASPGCQLAMAESHKIIRDSDPLAEYYGVMAEEVASAYGITGKDVAAAASFVCVQLQNTNQSPHPDQILLAAQHWTKLAQSQASGGERPKYLEFLDLYLKLREKEDKSHAQAYLTLCGQKTDDEPPEP